MRIRRSIIISAILALSARVNPAGSTAPAVGAQGATAMRSAWPCTWVRRQTSLAHNKSPSPHSFNPRLAYRAIARHSRKVLLVVSNGSRSPAETPADQQLQSQCSLTPLPFQQSQR